MDESQAVLLRVTTTFCKGGQTAGRVGSSRHSGRDWWKGEQQEGDEKDGMAGSWRTRWENGGEAVLDGRVPHTC